MSAVSFDLTNGVVLLRLICALFFIPHVIGKFTDPGPLRSFVDAGFKPPKAWMVLAGVVEVVLIVLLTFDIATPFAALVAAIHLLIAAGATWIIGRQWIWGKGGIEYCVFWGLVCVALATLTWPR